MIEKTARITRALVWIPAKLYELAVRLRIAAYETGYVSAKKLKPAVVSIGNITLGGTGKTPLVQYVASYLVEEGFRVAVLTRGYGRRSKGLRVLNDTRSVAPKAEISKNTDYAEFGDEATMTARALPNVPIVVDGDRYESGSFAEREMGAEVLILDDGYQHLALDRDLNFLVIDATDPFGGFEMVPFGRLREPLYAIKRADAVIINRAHRPFDHAQTLAIIKYFCGEQVPVMYTYSSIIKLRHLATGDGYDIQQFSGWNAEVMCGIGNPQAFADDILEVGINIVGEHFYGDHHPFSQGDLNQVQEAARTSGADMIVTTEKDAVRLEGLDLGEVPVYAADLEVLSDDEVQLKSLILRTLHQYRER